jgi:carotenoid cleavage dioxygenase
MFDSPARLSGPLQLARGVVYQWKPSYPTRFGVLPRNGGGGDVRWYETDPCFILHTLNAYEENGRIIVDGTRYRNGIDETLTAKDKLRCWLWRWIIDLRSSVVRHHQLDDYYEEFPRIDDRRSTLRNRFSYTLQLKDGQGVHAIAVIKRNLDTGQIEIRKYVDGVTPSEPVFVPRTGGVAEDDGWVMTYVTDLAADRTAFVVYDAQRLTSDPVAVVRLPVRVPTAFHGSCIPDDEWLGADRSTS